MESDSDTEKSENVVLRIENMSVWTPQDKSWWHWKVNKGRTIILDNISGSIKEGEFAAILGPSGAGKTTLLVALAGKCTLPMVGSVYLGQRDVRCAPGAVEIVPQFDVFIDELTVIEHLTFMAELKLGSCKIPENRRMLHNVLDELKLKKHSQTKICFLSGGEKRLLSLASSVLSSPQVLICDEPTTGLDSYNALLVVETLKKLSSSGKVVICSVHQPSTDLFKEFNSLLLIADGKLLFHGNHENCKALFESINLECPTNYNPAEFYIRAVSRLNPVDNVDRIMESYQDRFARCDDEGKVSARAQFLRYRRNWFKQVQLLLWRTSITLKRDIKGQLFQLFINVMISSMIIGSCYLGVSGTTQRGVQDVRGLLWLMTSEVSFAVSYCALFAFEAELPLFKKEVGTYSCSAYLVARFLGYIPRCLIWPAVLVLLTTLAVDLPDHATTAFQLIVILSVVAIASSAYGLGMGALFTSSGVMSDVMPCADLPLFLVAGAFLRISSMPVWLYPVKYLSHFYYAMDAVSNIYWRQIDYIDCASNSTGLCVNDGASVLAEAGYSTNFVLQDSLGLVFVTVMWIGLAYLGLKREERKGYAY